MTNEYILASKVFPYKKFATSILLFILFAIFNGLMPIVICLLAAMSSYGTQTVMGIGYITAIQLGLIQMGWSICIGIVYVSGKYFTKLTELNKYTAKEMFKINNFVTLIYYAITLPLYALISSVYNYIAVSHVNTYITLYQTYTYIGGSLIYMFVIGFVFNQIIYIYQLNKKIFKKISSDDFAIILFILFSVIVVGITIATLSVYNYVSKNNYLHYGLFLGLGLSFGALIGFSIISLINVKELNKTYFAFKNLPLLKQMFKESYKNNILIFSIQFFKGIAVVGVGIYLGANMFSSISINYQIGRNIWYNLLYILPVFGYGVADGILFFGVGNKNIYIDKIFRISLICSGLVFLLQFCLGSAMYFIVPELINVYLRHQNTEIIINEACRMIKNNPNLDRTKYLLTILLSKKEYLDKLVFLCNNNKEITITITNNFSIKVTPLQLLLLNFIIKPTSNEILQAINKSKTLAEQLLPILNKVVNNGVNDTYVNDIIKTLKNADPTNKYYDNFVRLIVEKTTTASPESISHLFAINYSTIDYSNWTILNNRLSISLQDLKNGNFLNQLNAIFKNNKIPYVTKSSYTFLYLCLWTNFYSIGLIYNNTKMVIRDSERNNFEFIFTLFMQMLVISLIVGLGMQFQYSTFLPVYDAWSVILAIIGCIAPLYYMYTLLKELKLVKKLSINKNLSISIQEYSEIKNTSLII